MNTTADSWGIGTAIGGFLGKNDIDDIIDLLIDSGGNITGLTDVDVSFFDQGTLSLTFELGGNAAPEESILTFAGIFDVEGFTDLFGLF